MALLQDSSHPDVPRLVVIANPGSNRWKHFEESFHQFWQQKKVAAELELVPWAQIIPQKGSFDGIDALKKRAFLRLESPGRDDAVQRLLLQAGSPFPLAHLNTIPVQKGRLFQPTRSYQGFAETLAGIHQSLQSAPHITSLANPNDLALMFDKNATAALLHKNKIPVPPSISTRNSVESLILECRDRHWPVTYVKLNIGSSASGIVVLHAMNNVPWGISSIIKLSDGFYNTRKLHRVERQDLYDLLEFLVEEGACIQRGIPMANIVGQNFDVRVIVVAGKVAFTIFRLSPHPMTNLHLGGQRGNWATCRAAIPTRAWLDAMDHCLEAAECFDAMMVGIDLVFEKNYDQHYILEVNAFGDFVPGWTNPQGQTIHQLEIAEIAQRQGYS